MTIRLTLSDEGKHLDSASVARLSANKREFVALPHRDVFGVVTLRRFCPVEIGSRSYLACVVTGSLFDPDSGRCRTTKQRQIVKDAPAQKPRKATKVAREEEGWMNEKRRAA